MSLKSDLNFIKTVLGNYKVGTFMPSSKYVIKKIIKEINPTINLLLNTARAMELLQKKF